MAVEPTDAEMIASASLRFLKAGSQMAVAGDQIEAAAASINGVGNIITDAADKIEIAAASIAASLDRHQAFLDLYPDLVRSRDAVSATDKMLRVVAIFSCAAVAILLFIALAITFDWIL